MTPRESAVRGRAPSAGEHVADTPRRAPSAGERRPPESAARRRASWVVEATRSTDRLRLDAVYKHHRDGARV